MQLRMLVPGPERRLQRGPLPANDVKSDGATTISVRYVLDPRRWGSVRERDILEIKIAAAEPEMGRTLARELLGVYAADGWSGVDQFAAGVFGLDDYSAFLASNGLKHRRFFGPLQGDDAVAAMRDHVVEDRRPLFAAFERERLALRQRVIDCRRRIRDAAVEVAAKRIERCRQLLLSEAQRYLGLAQNNDWVAARVLGGGRADAVAQGRLDKRGDEWQDLLNQLRPLQAMLVMLSSQRTQYLAARGLQVAAGSLPVAFQLASLPLLSSLASELAHRVKPDAQGMQFLALEIGDVASQFQQSFLRAAAGYPILFRLVDKDASTDRDVAIAATEILQDAWQACNGLIDDLDDPDKVWSLPDLIELTVRERFARETDFAERVAADTVDAVEREIHPFEGINYVVQALETSLMFFPPAELAIALVSLLANSAELAETYVREGAQRRSTRAALDPSLALAHAPSMLGMCVQAAFVALCVLPIPGLAKKWQADRASKAMLP
jgi:hypothetical protein